MKIAIFTESYLPFINGVITHIRLLKEGLEELGHDVLIITADPHVKRHKLSNGVLRCPAAAVKKIYGYGAASPMSVSRLNYMTKFNPDIIHIHTEFGVGFFGMHASILLKKPLVYTVHTMYDDYLHYVMPGGMVNIANAVVSRYLKLIVASTDEIIGPSIKVEEFFRRHDVDKKIHIIRNCADLRAFDPVKRDASKVSELRAKYNIPGDAKLMMHISRVATEKSIDVMINYFTKRFKDDPSYYMLIVGDGPAKKSLEEQVHLWGMDERIIFTGAVPNTEVPGICHASDIFVSASLSEIYSISMLEALSAGLPAIIRRDEINKGQIIHGVNGFIFDDDEEFDKFVRGYFALSNEDRESFKQGVTNSAAGYGSVQLAEKVMEVYQSAQINFKVKKSHSLVYRMKKLSLKKKKH